MVARLRSFTTERAARQGEEPSQNTGNLIRIEVMKEERGRDDIEGLRREGKLPNVGHDALHVGRGLAQMQQLDVDAHGQDGARGCDARSGAAGRPTRTRRRALAAAAGR
jgi:hypothetical protein